MKTVKMPARRLCCKVCERFISANPTDKSWEVLRRHYINYHQEEFEKFSTIEEGE